MEKTIISQDVATGKARIRFEHLDVTVEDDYDLVHVVPGSARVFEELGLTFGPIAQAAAITKLEDLIRDQIESGALQNPPAPVGPEA